MSNPYGYMKCPHCGSQTNVDPALVNPNDPMLYCDECDQPLFGDTSSDDPDDMDWDEEDSDEDYEP